VSAAVTGSSWENANIEVLSLKTHKFTVVHRGGHYARYLPSGHLVYLHGGTLFAIRFDSGRLQTHGGPVPVQQRVTGNVMSGVGRYDFSQTGTFLYVPGESDVLTLSIFWLDAQGARQPAWTVQSGRLLDPRFSPDGSKLAASLDGDIVVYDLTRDTPLRITFALAATAIFPSGCRMEDTSSTAISLAVEFGGCPRMALRHPSCCTLDIWALPLDLTDPNHPKACQPSRS
jgi:hypothetical protein